MSIFETVKNSVTPRQAAERYGLSVSRNGMVKCPFHDDHTPSMKLNTNYYYCFGCGASGDVIDLTAHLCGVGKYDAAKMLAADFGLPTAGITPMKTKPPNRDDFRERERFCYSVLVDYLHLLEYWRLEYQPQSPEETMDDRFIEAIQMTDYIEQMVDTFITDSLETREALVSELQSGDTILKLKTRLDRLHGEEVKQ